MAYERSEIILVRRTLLSKVSHEKAALLLPQRSRDGKGRAENPATNDWRFLLEKLMLRWAGKTTPSVKSTRNRIHAETKSAWFGTGTLNGFAQIYACSAIQ
jgi:hypothetical protein